MQDQSKPVYTFDLDGVDDLPVRATIYVTAIFNGKKTYAMFTVDALGNVERETNSDNFDEQPCDGQEWPLPPSEMIAKARQMAARY